MSESQTVTYAPPRGMRDFYPEEMAVRGAIFDAWRDASLRFGFEAYDACVVESLDLLVRKGGEEIVDQIYAFSDKSGRQLALRAEMTPTLARMVAARQSAMAFPLKWFTIAQCFRYERMTRGRKREHYQWNLDVVGEQSLIAEAEILAAAVHALAGLGLGRGDYQIRLSNRALLAELLAKAGIAPEHHRAVFLALDKRGKMPDAEIEAMLAGLGLGPAAVSAAFQIMAIATLEEAAGRVGADSPAVRGLNELFGYLEAEGIRDLAVFDISIIRGLGYYTGVVFEGFDCGRELRAIFGGGRYDGLLSDLGARPMTAVGFGFGDVVVRELLEMKGRIAALKAGAKDMAVGYMAREQQAAAMKVARAFRGRGRGVDLAFAPEKARAFFSRVPKEGFRDAVYLGPSEIESGAIRVKNLADRGETTVALSELLPAPCEPTAPPAPPANPSAQS